MKKSCLLFILLFSFALLPSVNASSSFSQPILEKAYEQVNSRIEQKIYKLIIDENSSKSIALKKVKLGEILHSIDEAFGKRDKQKFKEQVKLFRDGYKEVMIFIQNLKNTSTSPVVHKNIPSSVTKTTITGENTDITYYADSFEGRKTANGNTFSQNYFSAAACEIPFNTLLQVGKGNTSIIVKLNDRPNCAKHPNLTDLSKTAFETIGKISSGKLQGNRTSLGTVPKNYIKRTISSDIFKDLGIKLDANIPNTYLKNETFHIRGKELNGKEHTILYLKSPSGKEISLGMKKGADGYFEYSYPLEEVGLYQAVLASGLGFKTSTFLDITVLDDSVFVAKKLMPSTKESEQLKKLDIERIELSDFTPIYLFHFSPGDFHTISIKSDKQTFVYRGFGTIAMRGDTFKGLSTDKPMIVEVTSEKSSTVFSHDTFTAPVTIFKKTMTMVPGFKEERNENITITEENGNLIIHGIVSKGKDVKSDIIVTLPNGDVEKYAFDASSIDSDKFLKRSVVFEKTIPLKQTGIYLIEVNYENGFAAYNGPLVYGEILPVYPNEGDSVRRDIGNNDSLTITTESLEFVNNIRSKSGKSALVLDDALNNLATIKAKDMAKHNNLSHTDSAGEKILGTAKRNNIKIGGVVGENIAGGNISYRVLLIGLANSGGHRANMLDTWKKMGIGYAVKDGQVYYVQVFGE